MGFEFFTESYKSNNLLVYKKMIRAFVGDFKSSK